MRDRVQDLFGDAVAEVFVSRIAAHVDERQHGHRFHFRQRRRLRGGRISDALVGWPGLPLPKPNARRSNGGDSYDDDPLATRPSWNRPSITGALNALRRELEGPREDERDGKPQHNQHDDE
ncbi:MAG: hypothetical protein M3Q86_01020, partial [Verrucomicrobiota bacterium]|nr:hypothetical protein [Verrucomicrobiota bacterium]